MPIYEYECSDCGVISEAWQKITDSPLERCEHCGGRLKRLISQNTFHLKGTGWYVTDYAAKSPGSSKPQKDKGTKDESDSKAKSKSKKDD
ncbi:MAG TPA: zinc ribbon domain-containing protein [Desulfobacterales bacterium]|nr:zinc ribbon domain-containing protein [Desulfobacterales bacterium]